MIGHMKINIFPPRVWEQAQNGKWYSRAAQLEDHKRRREWLAKNGPEAVRSELNEPGETETGQ